MLACVYDNLRSVAWSLSATVCWSSGGTSGSCILRGRYAFHSAACTPATPREKGRPRARSLPEDRGLDHAACGLGSQTYRGISSAVQRVCDDYATRRSAATRNEC